jgi:hypothetical protein
LVTAHYVDLPERILKPDRDRRRYVEAVCVSGAQSVVGAIVGPQRETKAKDDEKQTARFSEDNHI